MPNSATSASTSPPVAGAQSQFSRVVAGSWIEHVIVATAVLVYFATPLLAARAAANFQTSTQLLIAFAIAVLCFGFTLILSSQLPRLLSRPLSIVAQTPFWLIVTLGLLLRAAWNLVFPAQPGSDAASYFELASRLAAGEPYFIAGTAAYWPVGYPLFLSAWITALGPGKLAWLASNLLLYLIAIAGIERIAKTISGATAGKVAALLFAVWPNYVASTATPEKEMLLVAILPWVTSLILAASKERIAVWHAVMAGAVLGACILTQPSLQFLPIATAILLVVIMTDKVRAIFSAAVFLLATVAVLAPWTLRNYKVFDRFVLVSTNGGSNLYRANNPMATGGYIKEGAIPLSALGEIEQDVRGRALAMEWIKSNPLQFASLAFEKTLRFTGDDAVGVYGTLKVGNASASRTAYAVLKSGANAFWILAWITLAAACIAARRYSTPLPPLMRLPFWLWLYLFALHSIFESSGKYHVPVAWVLCVLIAGYAAAISRSQEHEPA